MAGEEKGAKENPMGGQEGAVDKGHLSHGSLALWEPCKVGEGMTQIQFWDVRS